MISVIMPVHNAERYLPEAIESILAQTIADYEFIIVDDGSTDGTEEILHRYRLNDTRLNIIRNSERQGVTRSLNIALRHVQGEFVARQDADDFSRPTRFSEQLRFLSEHPNVDVVGCIPEYTGDRLGIAPYPVNSKEIHERLFSENVICHGSVMIRRSVFTAIGGYREFFNTSQDLDLWLRVAEKHSIENLDRQLYTLRIHSASVSHTKKVKLGPIAVEFAQQRRKCGIDDLGLQYQGYWYEPKVIHPQFAKNIKCYKLYILSREQHKSGQYLASIASLALAGILKPSNRIIRSTIQRDLRYYGQKLRRRILT